VKYKPMRFVTLSGCKPMIPLGNLRLRVGDIWIDFFRNRQCIWLGKEWVAPPKLAGMVGYAQHN
jgi:hypothetical protein